MGAGASSSGAGGGGGVKGAPAAPTGASSVADATAAAAGGADLAPTRAPRHRVAAGYRGPTLGGAPGVALSARSAPGLPAAQGAPSREAPPDAQDPARGGAGDPLPVPSRDAFGRRGRSTLVTAGGLINSSDIDSVVKQRRHSKKVPSAASLRAEQRATSALAAPERPGSAHARSVHSRAAKSDAASRCTATRPPLSASECVGTFHRRTLTGGGGIAYRPFSGRRKDGQHVWSDDDDPVDRLREAARQQSAASNRHLEARLRNVALHFRVPPPAAREARRTQALDSSRAADTTDPRPGSSTNSPSGGSAMRPAPPPSYTPSTPAIGGA